MKVRIFGSGKLSGKMLLVRVVENDIIYTLGHVRLSKGLLSPTGLGKE